MLKNYLVFLILITTITALNNNCNELKSASKDEKFHLAYQWKYINYTWPSKEKYEEAISSHLYIPGNSVILGVKYYKSRLYLALPKSKPGSPISIGYIPEPTEETKNNPLLTPFPDWETHLTEDCEKLLQDLQSFEIDQDGIMWVIDGRRIDNLLKKCPPKIVLLDLNQNGRVVQSYIPPDALCSHETCFMNDIVLDEVDGGFAYITDSSFTDPGLIIYSRKQNRAWKVRDRTMFAEKAAINFVSHGVVQSKSNNVNGIALAKKQFTDDANRKLYYTALSAFTLYSINSKILRNESIVNVEKFIENVGNKSAQSSGMIVDTKGQLYYGLVAKDTIFRWNTSKSFTTKEIIETSSELMPWPDSYTFDEEGFLYMIASNVDRFGAGFLKINEFNFKLSKLYTGTCSYIY